MRLWHYKLIPILPNKMLIAQWRECIAIKRQWQKGTLKHRLVSYVKDYDKIFFMNYVVDLITEMDKRKIKYKDKYYWEIENFCNDCRIRDNMNYPQHNDRYLKQCYYNLQEKYDREIINEEEWQRIKDNINIDYLSMCK